MSILNRRASLAMFAGAALLAASAPAMADTAAEIEQDVLRAESIMHDTVPGAKELSAHAKGVLIMPSVIKGGLIIGGSYGEGALKVAGVTEGFYSVTAASIGYQIGVQKTAHAVFFMTNEALDDFRNSEGWELGADAEFTVPGDGISLNLSTSAITAPVIAIVFAQDGLLAGASLEGAKISRVNR
jgi:lipid-binding SYLF domain-containing protein